MLGEYNKTTDTLQGVRDYFRRAGVPQQKSAGDILKGAMNSFFDAVAPAGRYATGRSLGRLVHGLPGSLPEEQLRAIDEFWRNSENYGDPTDPGIKPEVQAQLDAILDEMNFREKLNSVWARQGRRTMPVESPQWDYYEKRRRPEKWWQAEAVSGDYGI